MWFLDGLMGNVSEVDIHSVEKDLQDIITDSVEVEKAYKLIRD